MAVTFSPKQAPTTPANDDAAASATPANAANAPVQKPVRSRPTQTLPTDRIAFIKQLDLLRIYAVASGPAKKVVTLAEVETIIKMKASTISLANPFFTDIGLVQKSDKGFLPSDAVVNFQRAYQWNPETAAYKLAPVVQASWFAQRILPKVSYRPITQQEAINDLADACAAGPEYEPQLQTLLDYMAATGLVIVEGGQVRTNAAPAMESSTVAATETTETDPPASSAKSTVATMFAQPTEGTVQFHVSVRVDMAEFAGWKADRIAAFFAGIAQVLAAKGQIERGASDK